MPMLPLGIIEGLFSAICPFLNNLCAYLNNNKPTVPRYEAITAVFSESHSLRFFRCFGQHF